jgi:hypothetical protein
MSAPRRTKRASGGYDANSAAFYAELLAADKRARQAGTPLLTRAGQRYVAGLLVAAQAGIAAKQTPAEPAATGLPRWDGQLRRLFLGDVILKEFRQPALNQTCLLDAFQRRGWAVKYLTNPLVSARGKPRAKDRTQLLETIKSLNRDMPAGTIRFRSKGGLGVWWERSERTSDDGHPGTS